MASTTQVEERLRRVLWLRLPDLHAGRRMAQGDGGMPVTAEPLGSARGPEAGSA